MSECPTSATMRSAPPATPKLGSMYGELPEQRRVRLKAFTYHPPIGDQVERYQVVRSTASEFARLLNGLCPASRELSLAQTKLEEAVMWANAAIARNEVGPVSVPPE